MKTYNKELINELRHNPSALTVEKILKKSTPHYDVSALKDPATHVDERRSAYHYSAQLKLTQGRADVGYLEDMPNITVIYDEGAGASEEGWVHEHTFDGWLAYGQGSELTIFGVGRSPREAIADADLNLINEHFEMQGQRAPYIGCTTTWVISDLDENGELETVVLPTTVADTKESALELAEMQDAPVALTFAFVVELIEGHYTAFCSPAAAANFLMDYLARSC